MSDDSDPSHGLPIHTLADALGVGLELIELFAVDGDCCAVWLGGSDGSLRDFVICTDERGRDTDRLVGYAVLGATLVDDVARAVLWRTVDDIADGPDLARAYFAHRDRLASVGVTLVDEIALSDDELRSVAVTAFSDPPGWDDVTASLATLDGGEPVWPPWTA